MYHPILDALEAAIQQLNDCHIFLAQFKLRRFALLPGYELSPSRRRETRHEAMELAETACEHSVASQVICLRSVD